jgi:hypothetical protein
VQTCATIQNFRFDFPISTPSIDQTTSLGKVLV